MRNSVIVRTYNESQHLPRLLEGLARQASPHGETEVIIVDSGSTDGTLSIAEEHNATIVHIKKEDFSFGRSLNIGCEQAQGENLVFISGHCIPVDSDWLEKLTSPLDSGTIAYSYGGQIGDETSRFSECQLFRKYYPDQARVPQKGFFCNNANAALKRSAWENNRFDEELTGLEDMELAQRLVKNGFQVAYAADARVFHLHHESWRKVRIRYEREAIALQNIMPQIHVSILDFSRYLTSAIINDVREAWKMHQLSTSRLMEITAFRLMQYWGTYRGNHEHRKLSHQAKEEYFYPV